MLYIHCIRGCEALSVRQNVLSSKAFGYDIFCHQILADSSSDQNLSARPIVWICGLIRPTNKKKDLWGYYPVMVLVFNWSYNLTQVLPQ